MFVHFKARIPHTHVSTFVETKRKYERRWRKNQSPERWIHSIWLCFRCQQMADATRWMCSKRWIFRIQIHLSGNTSIRNSFYCYRISLGIFIQKIHYDTERKEKTNGILAVSFVISLEIGEHILALQLRLKYLVRLPLPISKRKTSIFQFLLAVEKSAGKWIWWECAHSSNRRTIANEPAFAAFLCHQTRDLFLCQR